MRFSEALASGRFVVTMDTMPPKGTNVSRMLRALEAVRGRVDGINVPDMPSAAMRLGSLPACHILLDHGYEPIMQMTCRDRNRLALQADLLGAAVLGIENVLMLGGDDVSLSDHPGARSVCDLNTQQLLEAARGLAQGVDLAGNPLQGSPRFCLGATVNPLAHELAFELEEMTAKVEAGAQFFQTQPVFDLRAFGTFMARADKIGVPVLAGVFLLKSARMARYMHDHVPEVHIPPWVLRELEDADDPAATGLALAAEVLKGLQGMCTGSHIMSIGWEMKVPDVLAAAGLD